ncbi:MAG TPA: ABC transporter permease [Candidatus Dormibacteraeota bacterium]|nr:ABC transporter permease [Candidatus Dormibacteraeota bacterium]
MATELATGLAGREVLETTERQPGRMPLKRLWSWLWPKLAAVALVLAAWQAAVWSGWQPDYVLPGPVPVFQRLAQDLGSSNFDLGIAITLRRALTGYAIAVAIGSVTGILVARVAVLRRAIGSAILGLQSMPSIVWFPVAILLFGLNETAIFFVVILGAAPSIAGGLLSGVDHVQPLLVRVGRVMGARGMNLYRYVILPAALPSFVGGLKQGWAFAWRSLMAGEIINVTGHQFAIGQQIQVARDFADMEQLLAIIVVIFVIGVVIDSLFGSLDRVIRRRWGLLGAET